MKYERSQLTGKIEVDGNEYIGCRFENAEIVIGGKAPFILNGCNFGEGVTWTFAAQAAVGINILTEMYTDPAFRPLVDAIIGNIKAGKTGPVVLH